MRGKFTIMFADLIRSVRQLWLEILGGIFLAFGLLFIITTIQEYRKYVSNPAYGTSSLLLSAFFSGVMLLFALESFWKARKHRQ